MIRRRPTRRFGASFRPPTRFWRSGGCSRPLRNKAGRFRRRRENDLAPIRKAVPRRRFARPGSIERTRRIAAEERSAETPSRPDLAQVLSHPRPASSSLSRDRTRWLTAPQHSRSRPESIFGALPGDRSRFQDCGGKVGLIGAVRKALRFEAQSRMGAVTGAPQAPAPGCRSCGRRRTAGPAPSSTTPSQDRFAAM